MDCRRQRFLLRLFTHVGIFRSLEHLCRVFTIARRSEREALVYISGIRGCWRGVDAGDYYLCISLTESLRCLQVVDSGLDQESCFFRDEDGVHVEGGHYYDEIAIGDNFFLVDFDGGYYPYDLERRKVFMHIYGESFWLFTCLENVTGRSSQRRMASKGNKLCMYIVEDTHLRFIDSDSGSL